MGALLHITSNLLVVISITCCVAADGSTNGFISFASTHVVVIEKEYEPVKLPLQRSGGTTGTVIVGCQILNHTSVTNETDFLEKSTRAVFTPGSRSSSCEFSVTDDNIPEVNETFPVKVAIISGGAEALSQLAYITTLANDDPHGKIGFAQPGSVVKVAEPLPGSTSYAVLQVRRSGGTINNADVHWRVTSSPAAPGLDLRPTFGYITFLDGRTEANITIEVIADEIPENEERFSVRLINVSSGAVLEASALETEVEIIRNDAPIRFEVPVLTFSEPQTQNVKVLRGIGASGGRIGPTNQEAHVSYRTEDGTAKKNVDYVPMSGILRFEPGITEKTLSVRVMGDTLPEISENFTVVLFNVTRGLVLMSPTTLEISISKNDDPHGVVSFRTTLSRETLPLVLSEDNDRIGSIQVNRSAGTFGTITVNWKVTALTNKSGLSLNKLVNPIQGVVTFGPGVSVNFINITALQNSIPQEAEEYIVELTSISGGGRLLQSVEGNPKSRLVLADSDNAYGVINFAAVNASKVLLSTSPRRIEAFVERSSGALGMIRILYSAIYLLPGSSIPSAQVPLRTPGSLNMNVGQNNATIGIDLGENGFLKTGSFVLISLLGVNVTGSTIVPPSSPILGFRRNLYVNITTELANGEISFFNNPVSLTVQEPDRNESRAIHLLLMRDGTAKRATVFWQITGTTGFSPSDVQYDNGRVVFQKGQDRVNLTIVILPDNSPELDETLTVDLINVTEVNERIRSGAKRATILIPKNDDPGGIFEFNSTNHIFLEESSSSVATVQVVRRKGDLTRQQLLLRIEGGATDFSSNQRVLTFEIGVTSQNAFLFPIDDTIPEINETFTLVMTPIGDTVIGTNSRRNVTILQNDDANGVISFVNLATNLNKVATEFKNRIHSVDFELQRTRGTFGSLSVSWNVTSFSGKKAGHDVDPVSGQVTFGSGQRTERIRLSVKQDEIPENAEKFQLQLLAVTGGARLTSPTLANLTIDPNDAAVSFSSPTEYTVVEGHVYNITVNISRVLTHEVTLSYVGIPSSAGFEDFRFLSNTSVIKAGNSQGIIQIMIINDHVPEDVEQFYIDLRASTGDTVLVQPLRVSVTILANDDAYGIFVFAPKSLSVHGREGQQITLSINRLRGTFRNVTVSWTAYSNTTSMLMNGTELSRISGMVPFFVGETVKDFPVVLRRDSIPELNETVLIKLVNITGGFGPEVAKLGPVNETVATIAITENDDPYGVFKFESTSLDVKIVEDFLPGMEYQTLGNFSVLRTRGLYGSVQLLWEVYKRSESVHLPVRIWDLIFHGHRGSAVRKISGRHLAATDALEFVVNVASYIFVRESALPPRESSPSAFSLSLWIIPNNDTTGTILSRREETRTSIIVTVSSSGGRNSIQLSVAIATGVENVTLTDGAIAMLFDGQWHSLILTITGANMVIYVDGGNAIARTLRQNVGIMKGPIYIGCQEPAVSHFSGKLQDIRLYTKALSPIEAKEIGQEHKALQPNNGYLVYQEGTSTGSFTIKSVDNVNPEPDKLYSVKLIDVKGGALLASSDTNAKLTVSKSDFSNGQFGFSSQVCNFQMKENDTDTPFTVKRTRSYIGSVIVRWEIKQASGRQGLAESDFLHARGQVVFKDGDREKVIRISANNDTEPELKENFFLEIVSAVSLDGENGSTPTSGASLRSLYTKCNISIEKNDYPYGMLQIMGEVPTTGKFIRPLPTAQNISVSEEAGKVKLYVTRAQGIENTVTCEWKTSSMSAKGGTDFRDSVGRVELKSGINNTAIYVDIFNNILPELEKVFRVTLSNPTGGAVLGAAAHAFVVILPSDDAYGVFAFAESSLNNSIHEGNASFVRLTLLRTGGNLGMVSVRWRIENGSNDFMQTTGLIRFSSGETSKTFQINIRNDEVPELDESFIIRLTNVTNGRLGSNNTTAMITIIANDYPYGLFQFLPNSYTAQERNYTISLTIFRAYGRLGNVMVSYASVVPEGVRYRATPNKDFLPIKGVLNFSEDQQEQQINLTIYDDNIPEADEVIHVNISSVSLVSGPSSRSSPDFRRDRQASVIIAANDDPSGVLQLSSAAINVSENHPGAFLNVTRTRGAFGTVSIQYRVIPGSATAGRDYVISSSQVTLIDQQTSAPLPISLSDDIDPELKEDFTVELLPLSIQGGAILGTPTRCLVTILESDYPYGLIGFSSASRNQTVNEPSGPSNLVVTLTAIRSGGTIGPIQLEWHANISGVLATTDVTPTKGNLRFLTGEKSQSFTVSILPDDVPEYDEVITITLSKVLLGQAAIDPFSKQAVVTVYRNDDPHGIVYFERAHYTVAEGSGNTNLKLKIMRSRGLFGDLRVTYRTIDSSVARKASPGADFRPIPDGKAEIGSGYNSTEVNIVIYPDTDPELDESFRVQIVNVELIGSVPNSAIAPKIGTPSTANVTILQNDSPYGLFRLRLEIGDSGSNGMKYTIFEPESTQTPVTFIIERVQGDLGDVSVGWRIASGVGPGLDVNKDLGSADGGRKDFTSGQRTKSFVITVKGDTLPERDEYFDVELYGVRGGAQIDTSKSKVRLIIRANDGVGGKIGFMSGSRSKVAKEGETVNFDVERLISAAGNVTLDWTLSGHNASQDFQEVKGKLFFGDNVTLARLHIKVLNDSQPESNERFTITLSHPITMGVSSSGAATLDPQRSIAVLFLDPSDDPHGIIEFVPLPRPTIVKETVGNVDLSILREKGRIGAINVSYIAYGTFINSTTTAAEYGKDFQLPGNSFIMNEGQDSYTLPLTIIDDSVPEQNEAFQVNLTGVHLVGNATVSLPPRLGKHTGVHILIEANDGTQGELAFAPESAKPIIHEGDYIFNLTVMRYKGTFGKVYAFYVLNRLSAGSDDFFIPGGAMTGPARIEFDDRVSMRNISIRIKDDNITEDAEQFEVLLTVQNAVGNGGVTIGNPSRALVTIASNDDAHGVFSFTGDTAKVIREPESGDTSDSEVSLTVRRERGAFGEVIIGWRIKDGQNQTDLSPTSGSLRFQANDREEFFRIKAISDNIPELNETFSIELFVISGGGRVGAPSITTITVKANDDPNGVFSIALLPSSSKSVNVNENVGSVITRISRSGGTFGKVKVKYETVAGTAIASTGSSRVFTTYEKIRSVDARSFHAFFAFGEHYLVMASTNEKGIAKIGQTEKVVHGNRLGSTLFRWQGVYVPLMMIHTDGAVQWISFNISSTVYLAVCNFGENGRHETVSQIFEIMPDGQLKLIQNITTQGAVDMATLRDNGMLYLIIANQRDNSGNTLVKSKVYRWDANQFKQQGQGIDTQGAADVKTFRMDSVQYLVIVNSFDPAGKNETTNTVIYQWNRVAKEFQTWQRIEVQDGRGVDYMKVGSDHYLIIVSYKQGCIVYRRTGAGSKFTSFQQLKIDQAVSASVFTQNSTDYLVVTARESVLYQWNVSGGSFERLMNLQLPDAVKIQPLSLSDHDPSAILFTVAKAGNADSLITKGSMISNGSDFVPRSGLLTYYPGQTSLDVQYSILTDSRPEMDENFEIRLSEAMGGAVISTDSSVTVTILSSDNAYGRIKFDDRSMNVNVSELSYDNQFNLELVREFGTFRQLIVTWNLTTMDGKETSDITPSRGQVVFLEGKSRALLALTVKADAQPELEESFRIKLTSVHTSGISNPGSGATINLNKNVAIVKILPNDDPYGVISWKNSVEITTEAKEINSSAILVLTRTKGSFGDVRVFYQTVQASTVSRNERKAIPGVDYVPVSSSVVLKAGVTERYVLIKVRHDNDTSVNEVFLVNITGVSLVNGTHVPGSPRVDQSKRKVEVVITEEILNKGTVEFVAPLIKTVNEDVGTSRLELRRQNGSEGTIGLHYEVISINTTEKDYSPQSGVISFGNNVTRRFIEIQITNDNLPELQEQFLVRLTKPVGGAKIGTNNNVTINILENDHPYGLLRFKPSSIPHVVQEGKSITLSVERLQGRYRSTEVQWKCDGSASADLQPISGKLTFTGNETLKTITIQAVEDTIPELDETYHCGLVSATNNAVIASDNGTTITIAGNDKPYGIVSIDPNDRVQFVSEPDLPGRSGMFTVRLQRLIGFAGTATVNWRISPNDGGSDDVSQTFNASSGTLTFLPGQKIQTLYLQVLNDAKPEESRRYLFALSGVSIAELDSNPDAIKSHITVVASENPYGIVEFDAPLHRNVSEDSGTVNVIVRRKPGLIGRLVIGYNITSTTAVAGLDYSPATGEITIDSKETAILPIRIINDTDPEVSETLLVTLNSIRVVTSKKLNFSSVNGLQIDIPPQLGLNNKLSITINENDYPYGIISFIKSSILVHEWDGRIEIPVNRTGGSFGVSEVIYDHTTIDALPTKDFIVHGNKLTFNQGESQKMIAITIIDDKDSEFQEKFQINLRRVVGGASLGAIKTITITIETSDNPNGLFGMYNISGDVFVPNPQKNTLLSFPLRRIGGTLGDILVKWRVIRLTPSTSAVTEDITPDEGTLFFKKGDFGPHPINVSVLTYAGPEEVLEVFRLNIYSINGGASLDQSANNVTITVGKKGHPNGLFAFTGTISPGKSIEEPTSGVTKVMIPVQRSEGKIGSVRLFWTISSTNGDVHKDITLGTSPLVFENGQTNRNIEVNITADLEPEVDETYTVILLSVTNNADIGPSKNITFTIRANDDPHGIFMLTTSEQKFIFDAINLTRSLQVSVERTGGGLAPVRVQIDAKYSGDASASQHSFMVANGIAKASTIIRISDGQFLMWNGSYTVRITRVVAISGSSMPPKIKSSQQTAQIFIPEIAANSVVEFNMSQSTLSVESDGNVNAVITRRGLFGSISTNWISGYPGRPPTVGLSVGPITPTSGNVELSHGQRSKTFSFKALIPGTLSTSLVYAVSIASKLSPSSPSKGWPILGPSRTAIVEPHGVIEVAPIARVMSVLEGAKASILLRRLYSTMGNIRVNYSTATATGANAATAGIDFAPVKSSIEFLQGQYEKVLSINVLEDKGQQNPEKDEVFYVDVTGAMVFGAGLTDNSPRISGQSRAVVTIQDNDDPYGVIGFKTSDAMLSAVEGTTVKIKVRRTGGTFRPASVRIRSLGGGETWESQILSSLGSNSPIKQTLQKRIHIPQASKDYVIVDQVVKFPEQNSVPSDGQEQEVALSIIADPQAEPPETFVLFLSDVTGGARLSKEADQLQAYMVVTINGNGLWNGEVGFTVTTGELQEDGDGKGSFTIRRTGAKSQAIEVTWAVDTKQAAALQLNTLGGKIKLASEQTTAKITLELKKDEVPEFAAWFWLRLTNVSAGAKIESERSAINVTVSESDYPAGRIGFDRNSRYPIINLGDTRYQLVVRRYNGTLADVTVKYQTVALPGVVTEGGVSLVPAVGNADFDIASQTLTFPKGRTEAYIDLSLTPLKASKGSYPKVFNVTLMQPTDGAKLYEPFTSSRLIISDKSETSQFLRLFSSAKVLPLSDKEIESIMSQLLALVSRPPLSTNDQNLAMSSIRAVTAYKQSQLPGKRALSSVTQQLLLDIFNVLLQTSRTDTRSNSAWAKLLEETVYHFLNDRGCPSSFKRSLSNFGVNVEKNNGSKFNGKKFISGNGNDFLRYPVNMFPSVGITKCTSMHFIDYANQQWFATESKKAILNNKIVSSSVKDKPSLSFKVVYRIHAPKSRVTPSGVSCAIWIYPTFGSAGSWSSQNCKVKGETTAYVECECQHLSEYAVLAQSDDRTGYELYFYVACFVCLGACLLALIAHHFCALETTISADLLMHMLFAVMVSNILYAVGAYVSPSLITNANGCGALGVAIHYFLLAQFTWMFGQSYNLWCILVMNDEHTYRKFVPFFLIGWGLPVVVILVYVFITFAIWSWKFTSMYGDVHQNGEMCFMANSYSALGSVLIPILLLLMGVIVVFIQAYQVTPQWKCYDDVYRGRYNIKEIRHLMILFTFLTLTWLFAGLHLVYGYLWMIIIFTVLDVIVGLYILIVYAILRNQMRYLYKRKYPVRTMPPVITTENYTGYTPPRTASPVSRKMNESQQRLDLNEWEDVDMGNLTPIPDIQSKARVEDFSPYPLENYDVMGHVNDTFEDDEMESQDLDDLIFALKTGGQISPPIREDNMEDDVSIPAFSSEHYEMRRIEIADTHL